MSAKTAWATVTNSACSFSLFLYLHLKVVFFLFEIQPCKKSEKAFICITFEVVTQQGCRKLSVATLIPYTFLFFYPWLTKRHVKMFSLSYANLFYCCFVNNYRKFFIALKPSYFTKVFARCLQPIIIQDVLFTSGNFNSLKEIIYFKIKLAGMRLFVAQRRKLPFYWQYSLTHSFPKIFNFTVLQIYLSYWGFTTKTGEQRKWLFWKPNKLV